MQNIDQIIQQMHDQLRIVVRTPHPLSWGDRETCKCLFREIFCQVDKTFHTFHWLPEYDAVVNWMQDTQGKGLLLMGHCGRGKSIIATGVVPVLLRMHQLYVYPVAAREMNDPYPFARSTEGFLKGDTNLIYLNRIRFPILDELGVERICNDYGVRFEGFNEVLDNCEKHLKPIVVTTNLTELELLDRYGERVFDRLMRLCFVIPFRGESLRSVQTPVS